MPMGQDQIMAVLKERILDIKLQSKYSKCSPRVQVGDRLRQHCTYINTNNKF